MEYKEKDIYLIGEITPQIQGRKLPTNRQVLQVFLYHHLKEKLTIRKSSDQTVSEIITYWNRVGIPVSANSQCIVKLEKLHSKWLSMKKSKFRVHSPTQQKKISDFKYTLNQLFDISQRGVMNKLTDDQRLLLSSQQNSSRRGFIPLSSSTSSVCRDLPAEFSNIHSMVDNTSLHESLENDSSRPSTESSKQTVGFEENESDQQQESKYYDHYHLLYCPMHDEVVQFVCFSSNLHIEIFQYIKYTIQIKSNVSQY